ncbi:MAG: hypothetical protein U9O18_11150 [Chloroflexota bacterium]|nr:hypothetical protein [Chloroflexota bacterium]
MSEGPIRFDVATDRMSNPRAWHPGTPPARAYVIGGLVLAWLDRYGLLAEWVQGAAAEELQEMRSGDGRPSAAYRALDGILATDMMCSPGREFVTYLHSPRRGGGAGRIDQLHAKWKGDLDWYELEDTPDVVAGALDDLDKEYKEFRDAIWLYRRIHRRQWKLPPRAT